MYPYLYPAIGVPSPCYYCAMAYRPSMQSAELTEIKSMMRGAEEFEEDRVEKGSPTPPMQQMPSMGQQMPDMMDMSKVDMGKIKADTQEIVRMLEQYHPDIIRTLTGCGMSMGQASQYMNTGAMAKSSGIIEVQEEKGYGNKEPFSEAEAIQW